MAFVVEDGTIVAGANSLVSVADARAFLEGAQPSLLSAWDAATTEAAEAALREATRYINITYRFEGELVSRTQPLPWPRTGTVDRYDEEVRGDVVPGDVKDATALLGALALTAPLINTKPAVKSRRTGSTSEEYVGGHNVRVFAEVRRILAPFVLTSCGGPSVPIRRVS